MSAIHNLISQIGDPRSRERLAAEWKAASTGRKFGMVFEDHLPELLPLPKARPRRGDLVCRRSGALTDVWQVRTVKDGVVTCAKPQDETHPSEPTRATADTVNFPVDEVMVVREFGEPIFPSLVPVDAVANGPADAPWHTLIEAATTMRSKGRTSCMLTRCVASALIRPRPASAIAERGVRTTFPVLLGRRRPRAKPTAQRRRLSKPTAIYSKMSVMVDWSQIGQQRWEKKCGRVVARSSHHAGLPSQAT